MALIANVKSVSNIIWMNVNVAVTGADKQHTFVFMTFIKQQ